MLDVWERLPALWTQACGPQQPGRHCLSSSITVRKMKTRPTGEDTGNTLQEHWPFATCESFWWKMPLRVTQLACLWILADSIGDVGIGHVWLWVSLYFDLSVCGWVHTLITKLWRTLCLFEVEAWASAECVVVNGNDEQMAVTQQPKPSVSVLLLMIQCSRMNYERHLRLHWQHLPPLARLHSDSLLCHHHSAGALHAGCHCLEIIPPAYMSPQCIRLYMICGQNICSIGGPSTTLHLAAIASSHRLHPLHGGLIITWTMIANRTQPIYSAWEFKVCEVIHFSETDIIKHFSKKNQPSNLQKVGSTWVNQK